MKPFAFYKSFLWVIYVALFLNGCKNPEITKDFGKVVVGGVSSGAASALTNFFISSKSQAQLPDRNLNYLIANSSLANEARIAEIKEAINFANATEVKAYRSLNPNLLDRAYTGKALQLRQTLVNNLADQKTYQIGTLHNQQFNDFKISSDGSIAKVEMIEKWSSELYSSNTNTLIGQFPLHDVPQVVYLEKDSSGWRISAIVFQGDSPEFIPVQQSPILSPQSAASFNISDHLGTDMGQVSEQITMIIDEKMVGTLTVNQNYPEASLTVTVPNPGRYPFKADARAVFNDGVERTCAGEGEVDISDGKSFSIVANLSNNSCSLALLED
jgi:hypothetical protein